MSYKVTYAMNRSQRTYQWSSLDLLPSVTGFCGWA